MEKKYMSIEKNLTISDSPFNKEQLLHILQRTPKQHIYKKPGKGGGEFEFVTGAYVKKVLNYCFGWLWNFTIKEHGVAGKSVWVLGTLSIQTDKGLIIKEQFGRADIKFKRNTEEYLDFGNDLKAAATDALKKCASELGIASDIYGKNEFREIQAQDAGFKAERSKTATKPESSPKLSELKAMLTGETDNEKLKDLFDRTGGVVLKDFLITEKHASELITKLLHYEI